jgi:UTP--glucose-1-phosphate uridylyltransferase
VDTAVITTGGLGTRLLTFTKTNPKTMLPVYEKSRDGNIEPSIRPLIEFIFENLYEQKFRRFCFVVGKKTQNNIKNHLLPDLKYVELLEKRNNPSDKRFVKTLNRFYKKIENCEISWVTQNTPMGFGHALLSSKKFVNGGPFLLHTGDAYFPNYQFITEMIKSHVNNDRNKATILLQQMKNLKGLGIAQCIKKQNNLKIIDVEEKPRKPKSNFAILPAYIFESEIFEALKVTNSGHNNELQVTDAVKTMLNQNQSINGFKYMNKWYDIGSPKNYLNALNYSYKNSI